MLSQSKALLLDKLKFKCLVELDVHSSAEMHSYFLLSYRITATAFWWLLMITGALCAVIILHCSQHAHTRNRLSYLYSFQ